MINMSSLNGYVTLARFKMETVSLVLGLMRKGDSMFSIDLRDAFFFPLLFFMNGTQNAHIVPFLKSVSLKKRKMKVMSSNKTIC